MKKNIWIFHHYASSANKGALVRPFDFSRNLIKKGYNPKIFCSNFNHYTKEITNISGNNYKEQIEEGVPFIYVKNPSYDNNGFDRVKNMLSYFFGLFSVTKKYSKDKNEKPDVIIASSPHPLTCIAGILIAKRYKIPCIVEIRDLWPESIVAYSTRFTKKHPLIKLLYQGEKWIYKNADKLIFTMPGGYDYIKEQKWDNVIPKEKCFHLNNGVDLELFNYNKENHQIKDEDLENDNIFKVVYTGSIRKINNLGILLDSAKEITNPKVKFLIWGGGNELEMLKQRVIDENITNVCFKGSVEKKYVPYILSKADVNLCHNKYTDLFRFGISFNKLFDYYASAKPILIDFNPNYNPVDFHNCGLTCSYDNMHLKIDDFINLSLDKYTEMCENSKKTAQEYDFKILTQKLIDIIEWQEK